MTTVRLSPPGYAGAPQPASAESERVAKAKKEVPERVLLVIRVPPIGWDCDFIVAESAPQMYDQFIAGRSIPPSSNGALRPGDHCTDLLGECTNWYMLRLLKLVQGDIGGHGYYYASTYYMARFEPAERFLNHTALNQVR